MFHVYVKLILTSYFYSWVLKYASKALASEPLNSPTFFPPLKNWNVGNASTPFSEPIASPAPAVSTLTNLTDGLAAARAANLGENLSKMKNLTFLNLIFR